MVVLIQDSPELNGGEGTPHVQLHDELAVQPAEDAGADAGDKEDPELLQVGLPLRARASISSGAMRTLSVLGCRETVGMSFIP